MNIWEKSYIVLIKNNQELIKQQAEAKVNILKWQQEICSLAGLPEDDVQFMQNSAYVYLDGCKKQPLTEGWKKYADGLYRLNPSSKIGKELKSKLTNWTRGDKLWIDENKLSRMIYVVSGGKGYTKMTNLSMNADATEFILFYPKSDGDDKDAQMQTMQMLMEYGEIITEGQFVDNYRETHMYALL